MRVGRLGILAVSAALLALPAHAVCFAHDPAKPYGIDFDRSVPARTFSAEEEFAGAFIVAMVQVVAAKTHFDKDGLIADHTYRVITRETFKGQALSEFTLYNPNNSARFDMDIGKTYLVFVIALGGRSVIDSCGWSDPLSAATNTLLKVRSLSATTRPQTSP